MKQEDKKLLFRYLSMALPYGVKAKVWGWDEEEGEVEVPLRIYSINADGYVYFESNKYDIDYLSVEECCLYLRPMSSMTEEEKEELLSIIVGDENKGLFRVLENGTIESTDEEEQSVKHFSFRWIDFSCESVFLYTDWMLKKHFDFLDLIPKGLAIENN